jgi:hypothetical protein
MTRLYLFFLLLPFINLAKAQTFQGQVVDAQSKKPLEFVQVYIPQTTVGTISDMDGKFSIGIPGNIEADSFTVFVLGYEQQSLPIKAFQEANKQVFLKSTAYQMNEVEVISKGCKKIKKKIWGPNAKKGLGFFYVALGAQIAVYIPNDKQKVGYLESVRYYIAQEGIPDTKFRVRVYAADGKDGGPGTDLLHENILLQASQGEEWIELNMTDYNIELPEDGLYVAMEWLPENSPRARYGTGQIRGQVLGGILTSKKKEEVTWSKDFLSGKWKQHQKNKDQENTISPLINVRVGLCP